MNIDQERDALLIIDLQPDFMPGGSLAVAGGDELVAPIEQLIPKFSCVVATQDWHPANHISFASQHANHIPFSSIPLYGQPQTLWPDHCVQGSPGAKIHLTWSAMNRVSFILRKGMDPRVDSYSAFRENWGPDGKRRETGLLGFLLARRIRRVYLCGLARDYCVLWTALDAAMALEPHVIWDLTRSVSPENDNTTREKMRDNAVKIV